MHIGSFSDFLLENRTTWLSKKRIRYPKPKYNESMWEKVSDENTSKPTQLLLDKYSKNFSDLAIFSWHPNIEISKYTETFKDDYKRFESDRENGAGHREWVDGSIIAKYKPGAYNDDWHDPNRNDNESREILDKTFTWMKGGGGSGHGDKKRGYEVQSQPSFLYTHEKDAGTFEEMDERRSRLTAGAFTQRDDGWYMIPADAMNPLPEMEQERLEQANTLARLFSLSPQVDEVRVSKGFNDNLEPTVHIKLEKKKDFTYHPTGWGTVNGPTQTFNKDTISIQIMGGMDWYYEMDGKLKTRNLQEILDVVKLFDDDENKALAEDPNDYETILHKYRGRLLGKELNVA